MPDPPPPPPLTSFRTSTTAALTAALDKVRAWALKAAATGGAALPPLLQRRAPTAPDLATSLGVADAVPSWDDVRALRGLPAGLARGDGRAPGGRWPPPKPAPRGHPPAAAAAAKAAPAGGRTYTSRYRGVHQTFPTRRWEAQFRRGGRPTIDRARHSLHFVLRRLSLSTSRQISLHHGRLGDIERTWRWRRR